MEIHQLLLEHCTERLPCDLGSLEYRYMKVCVCVCVCMRNREGVPTVKYSQVSVAINMFIALSHTHTSMEAYSRCLWLVDSRGKLRQKCF